MKKLTIMTGAVALMAVALTMQAFTPSTAIKNSAVACGGCTNSTAIACGGCTNALTVACGGGCTNTLLLACGGGCTNSLTF